MAQQLSPGFIEKLHKAADDAADAYVQALYQVLQAVDLSAEGGPGKAHGILNMIEQIQKMQIALQSPTPTREERKEVFARKGMAY